jgi:predicted ester cyclase
MSPADLRQLYRRWMLELWNGDLAVAEELVTDDFVVHQARVDGASSEEVRGPEAVLRMVREGHAPFDGLAFEIEVGPVVEGDMMAARWVGRGRYRGGMPGATAPAGTPVAFGGIDLLRARDGQFAEYWVSSDGLQLMVQLGALGPGA